MALNGLGMDVGSKIVDPGTLNAWLEANDGYECLDGDCNNLKLGIIDKLTANKLQFVSEAEKPSEQELRTAVTKVTSVYIAHVHHNSHFVLLTSWNDSVGQFNVLDPFYPSVTYGYSNISDVIEYRVASPVGASMPRSAVVPFTYPLYKQVRVCVCCVCC